MFARSAAAFDEEAGAAKLSCGLTEPARGEKRGHMCVRGSEPLDTKHTERHTWGKRQGPFNKMPK